MDEEKSKSKKKIIIIGVMILLVICASYIYFKNKAEQDKNSNPVAEEKSGEPSLQETYNDYLKEGLKYKSEGDGGNKDSYYKAIEAYQNAVTASEGKTWVPFSNLGNVYKLVGDYDNAEKAYNKAIEISPVSSLYLAKIDLYRLDMKKSVDEISVVYKEAIAKNADDLDIVTKYAAYLRDNGKNEESLAYWKIAAEKIPTDQRYKDEIAALEAKIAQKK